MAFANPVHLLCDEMFDPRLLSREFEDNHRGGSHKDLDYGRKAV